MGIFQDPELRAKRNLRSQFSNPWLNFSAAGTTFGSILKSNDKFDLALALSSGRNKFNTNEILASMLLSLHNINFYQELMSQIRKNINSGTFDDFHNKYIDKL